MEIKCPNCSQDLNIDDESLGIKFECPSCGQSIEVEKEIKSVPPVIKKKKGLSYLVVTVIFVIICYLGYLGYDTLNYFNEGIEQALKPKNSWGISEKVDPINDNKVYHFRKNSETSIAPNIWPEKPVLTIRHFDESNRVYIDLNNIFSYEKKVNLTYRFDKEVPVTTQWGVSPDNKMIVFAKSTNRSTGVNYPLWIETNNFIKKMMKHEKLFIRLNIEAGLQPGIYTLEFHLNGLEELIKPIEKEIFD